LRVVKANQGLGPFLLTGVPMKRRRGEIFVPSLLFVDGRCLVLLTSLNA